LLPVNSALLRSIPQMIHILNRHEPWSVQVVPHNSFRIKYVLATYSLATFSSRKLEVSSSVRSRTV